MKNKKALLAVAVISFSSLVGCASQKSQKQAAAEQWGRTRATVLLSLANDQYRSGNLDKCGETVNQAMSIDPTNIELHLLKARLQIEDGQLESALKNLDTARTLNPEHAEIEYLTGVIHQRWQRPQQALDSYAAAARKKPDDIAYLMAQSEMLVSMDRQPEALTLLLARVVYFEHSAAIRDAIAQLYEQADDLGQAIEYYRQASILDTADDSIRERLAWALYRNGDHHEAYSQLNRLMRLPENQKRTDILGSLAECEFKLGMYIEARRHFDDLLNVDANLLSAQLGVARSSLKLNDLRRADIAATKAVALQPRSSETQITLGYVRMRQGKYEDAVASFKRASAANPDDTLSVCMIGLALQRQGKVEEANRWYERAMQIDPQDELAVKLLADARD